MPKFNSDKHIISLQRKQYILFPGLLAMAHDSGNFIGVDVRKLQHPNDENGKRAIFEATSKFLVREPDGSIVKDGDGNPIVAAYTAQGDASPADLSRNMVPSLLRMAETRAVARSLRFGTASEYTAYDELPEANAAEGATPEGRPS